jgi:hypothetical protein
MRWPSRARRRAPLALLALALWLAAAAHAAPPRHSGGGAGAPQGAAAAKHRHEPPAAAETPQLASLGEVSAGSAAQDLGASGQVDPLSGLGIRNPVCDQLGQIRDRQTRLSCEASGAPEGNYPASNYGFDIFITTGVTHPVGDIIYAFATLLNGVWLGLIFVLKLVLALLGLGFGLNPFADGPAMSRISAAIGRLYAEVTDPWLSTLVVAGGIWFAYKGLLRREVAAGVAGTLAALAMLIVGLWVVHQPRESAGRLAGLANEVALGVISAPQSGSVSRPSGSYAEAMSHTWARLVEVPFAGLDFSDVRWALGRPPDEAVRKADEKFCDDVGALALLAVLSELGSEQATEACASFARRRYGRPRRVIDLYLRSSPGSPARQALWDYFNGEERYKAKVAAQGGDGVLTRLSMLALFAIGLLGAILLLAWLAIRLFTQAAIAFVLLLAAPFALFFPLLGDSGRRAFKTWGLTLLGAIAAKVIYAAFLSVVLLGIAILGASGGATGFLLACAFTWAVFLKRAELVGWMSIGDIEPAGRRGFVGQVAAFAIARRMSRGASGALQGVGRRGAQWRRVRGTEGAEATRATAEGSLRGRARALADSRYGEARRSVAEFEARHGDPGGRSQPGETRTGGAAKSGSPRASSQASAAERTRYERARALVARAERNERSLGQRWSERDLDRFADEDRQLLRSSRNPADHAHRAGFERAEFEALRGEERERAEAAIEKATKRDRQRLDVASELPGRIVGRGRQLAERVRQHGEGDAGARREQLRRLRRERRAAQTGARRNLSRGA